MNDHHGLRHNEAKREAQGSASWKGTQLFGSIRAKLILLVLIAILPVSGVVIYSGLELQKEQTAEAHEKALELVRNLAIEHERTVASTRQLVMALSKLPEVQSHNKSACNTLFAALLEQNKLYTNIIALGSRGDLFASGLPSAPLNLAHRKHFQDAIKTKEFSPGEYIVGRTTHKPIFSFAYPVLGPKGDIRGVMVASTDLDWYGQLLITKQLPAGGSFTITDHKGIVLFRYPQIEGWKGKPDKQIQMDRMLAGPEEGTFPVTRSGDKGKYIVAYKKFHMKEGAPPYLFMRISLSEAHALARAKKSLMMNLSFLGIAFFTALLSALFIGNREIVGRLRTLVGASRELSRGNLQARSGLREKEDEIGVLSLAFDNMADKLEENESLRKEAQAAMSAQNSFLQNLINAIPNPIFYKDNDGVYRGCNKAFEEYVGLPREGIVGKTVFEVHPKDVAETYFRMDTELFAHPGTQAYETLVQHSSGARRNIIISKATFDDSGGVPAGLIGVMVDITDRKYAEERLRESETQLRQIIDLVPHMIFVKDWEGKYLLVNRAVADGYNKTVSDLEGKSHSDFHPEHTELRRMLQDDREVMGKGEVKIIPEEPYTDAFGVQHFLQTTKVPFYTSGHERAVLGVAVDITAHKKADEQIKASLREKEVLLKEIHHRVKNNLQVMSSLLNLQTQYLVDPRALEALRVSTDRIKTMALIHDKLYRSETLSKIYFPGYVDELAHNLLNAYAIGKGIVLNLDVDPVSFNVDTAIPLGLIVNELVTNSLKHAFPGQETGMITIGLYGEDTHMTLVVSDTGAGFPENLDFRDTQSMGMQLVVILVEQLEGTVELKRDKGTEFRITFQVTE